MTSRQGGPAFRNTRRRQELEQEAAAARPPEPAPAGPSVVDPDLAEQVLRLAWDLGLNVSGRQAQRGVKGKVQLGSWIWAETNDAL